MAYTAYKRNYFTAEGQIFLLKLGAVGVVTICSAFVLRALGRATNSAYLEFNQKYRSIISNYNNETKVNLRNKLKLVTYCLDTFNFLTVVVVVFGTETITKLRIRLRSLAGGL